MEMRSEVKDSSTSPSIEFDSLNPDQKKSFLNLTKFLNRFVIKPEKKIFSRFEVFALLFIISGCNTAKKKSSVNEGQSEGESQSGIVADGYISDASILCSCRFSFFRLFEVCRIWRALVERGVRAFGVVKADPVISDPLCLKAVRNLSK